MRARARSGVEGMCTITVHRGDASLRVTMNRDETKARADERSPEFHEEAGVSWLGPVDGNRGGTWMGVSNYGVVACLMNLYREGDDAPRPGGVERRSRGEIVPWLLRHGPIESIRQAAFTAFDPRSYPSFTVLLATSDSVETFDWAVDTPLHHRTHENEWTMLTSSSWKTDEVLAWRGRAFDAWLAEGAHSCGALPTFHVLQPGGEAEWAPLMERWYAATKSITQVQFAEGENHAVMQYWPRTALRPGACDAPREDVLPLRNAGTAAPRR